MGLSKKRQNQLFQAGYLAKGIVYLIMGGFAVATVIGAARSTGGPKSVIDWIGNNPLGQILLFLVGTGLLAYCVWRWYKAVQDTENEGTDVSGSVKRIGWAISGTAYGALAIYTFRLVFGNGGGSSNTKQDAIDMLLAQSWGQIAVGVIGVVVAGVGVYQVYRAVQDKHMDGFHGQNLSQEKKDIFRNAGRVGLSARAVVYGVIAFFLFRTATLDSADQFRGIGEALAFLEKGSLGVGLLAAVGLGLVAYGFFMLVKVKYERV